MTRTGYIQQATPIIGMGEDGKNEKAGKLSIGYT